MYQKLFKNLVLKNLKIFLLIFFSISISLFAFIFIDSVSKYFLLNINNDTKVTLAWDFVIDVWNKSELVFNDFYEKFPYKDEVEIAKEYSIRSSIKVDDVISSYIYLVSENYPLYSEFKTNSINLDSKLLTSSDFYNKHKNKSINIYWNDYLIWSTYDILPKNINNFFTDDILFFPLSEIDNLVTNDSNSLIEKKYFIKLNNPLLFDEIKKYISGDSISKSARISDSMSWWDRFWEIINNLKNYINYVVLFSLIITSSIIFIWISSFFRKERKNISILRILWLTNTNLIYFCILLFIWLLILWFTFSLIISYLSIFIANNLIDEWIISIAYISIFKWFLLWIVLTIWSIFLPLYKFIKSEINSWFKENFFLKINIRDVLVFNILSFILFFIVSSLLSYEILSIIYSYVFIIIFWLIIYFVLKVIQKIIYNFSHRFRRSNFLIFDSIRSTIKPWNLSFLLNFNFFIIFVISLFVTILFSSFYDRLKINIDEDNNFFVINLTQNWFDELDNKYIKDSYWILKWRISLINWVKLEQFLWSNYSRRFAREYNITDNKLEDISLVSWKKITNWWVSLDYNFSNDLWLKLWDTITLNIYWIEKKLVIQNIRESKEYSINPFFYFQVHEEEFLKFPKTYFISSTINSSEKEKFKNYIYDISKWSASFIDVDIILSELKVFSQKVLYIIIFLFSYIMIFSLLFILIVIFLFNDFQKWKSKLYEFLWTNKKQNNIRIIFEYFYLATINFILSIIVVSIFSYYFFINNNFISLDIWIYLFSIFITFIIYISFILLVIIFWRE